MSDLRARIGEMLDAPVSRVSPLHGGMVADVQLLELADGKRVVAKTSRETPLSVEARMLEFLGSRTGLTVPEVFASSDDLLVLEFIEGDGRLDSGAERHAADLLAELHSTSPDVDSPLGAAPSPDAFGFHFDTLIGPFDQPNTWKEDWAAFYREARLRPMLQECLRRGRLDERSASRFGALFDDLPGLLDHSPRPGLVHGDVWNGNVLAGAGRITGLLDPALYYADPEIELAFIELFSTFGQAFWQRYEELRSVEAGYSRVRRDVYQLYPLLVHVALFGGSYVRGVEERLSRVGY